MISINFFKETQLFPNIDLTAFLQVLPCQQVKVSIKDYSKVYYFEGVIPLVAYPFLYGSANTFTLVTQWR